MTCRGCGHAVTLIDGHFCGHCSGQISRAVSEALEETDAVDGDVHDVTMAKDGLLYIRVDVTDEAGDGEGEADTDADADAGGGTKIEIEEVSPDG
ncbi:hypothetical protein [Natronosalvus rutilus]|uniref:Uncharacterized protein n=1 Tax=Natronosalvus rutilus TaxID=2953753 RepID=A0A9E7ND00_9EURY|nr:hypothetical protein [Natronosalvus rutilus]UTF56012.1 hypothetical protein NGM29_20710 [Natronosalvus rutilus]